MQLKKLGVRAVRMFTKILRLASGFIFPAVGIGRKELYANIILEL
jgi:hypothetical protein